MTIVKVIFQTRGEARQETVDTWLTNITPQRNWRDKYKDDTIDLEQQNNSEIDNNDGTGLGGNIL